MGFLAWFYRQLDRGEAPAGDPSIPVEVAYLRLSEAPLWVARLDDEGIVAYYVESYGIATGSRNRARLFVRRRDVPQARAILES